MDSMESLEKICRSSKDISIINKLLELHGSDNALRIPNDIGKYSGGLSVSRQKLNSILKRMEEANLVIKINIGVYAINPVIWVGRRVRSNELRQLWWASNNDSK